MSTSDSSNPSAWQPFTFGGVAAFGTARLSRFIALLAVASLLFGGALAFIFNLTWLPVVSAAVHQLPPRAQIRYAQLNWPDPRAVRLAENKFLAIEVDLQGRSRLGQGSDIVFELRRSTIRAHSLLGFIDIPYPSGWIISLNRSEALPWFGAWREAIVIGAALASAGTLVVAWLALGALYAWPVKLIAFFADREAPFGTAWRTATAAMIPGGLFLTLAVGLYAIQQFDLITLLVAFLVHFGVGWLYVLIAPLRLPRRADAPSKNPFASAREPVEDAAASDSDD